MSLNKNEVNIFNAKNCPPNIALTVPFLLVMLPDLCPILDLHIGQLLIGTTSNYLQ